MLNTLVLLAIVAAGAGNAEAPPADSDEAEFVPLFNENDLTGWTGDTEGYYFEDGVLVVDPTGKNLYTTAEYADFVLRFEFKLTPGANNGIGIRVPVGDRASREGLEIQILDDSAEKFANIKPWQRHGSVYGIVPAEPGHLRPVGEWNEQEIRVEGTKVKVVLNGAVIVDTDLAPFRAGEPTMDEKEHPGVHRNSGRISLAGHKTKLFFRNMRIRELEDSAAGS